jgi:hypothetical protein
LAAKNVDARDKPGHDKQQRSALQQANFKAMRQAHAPFV